MPVDVVIRSCDVKPDAVDSLDACRLHLDLSDEDIIFDTRGATTGFGIERL